MSGPHLVRSWTEIPHVTQHDEVDITEMEQFRSSLYDYYSGEIIKVTPLAFIAKALVTALKEFPNFNELHPLRRSALIDFSYQFGHERLKKELPKY